MQINEKTGLYENYGVWHVPFWQTESFLLGIKIVGALFIVLVVTFLLRAYLCYRKKKQRASWQQALYDVQQLKVNHIVYSEKGKEFYGAVSDILKIYFFKRFDYDVLGKTDTEIIPFLEENNFDSHLVAEIKELLQGGVFIKFANVQAAQERINKDYDRVVSIITLTIPKTK